MKRLQHCRACLGPQPYLFLPMGEQPPAAMLVRPAELGEVQPSFSLDAHVCLQCGLIEIADQMPRDFFRDHLRMPPANDEGGKRLGAWARSLPGLTRHGVVVNVKRDGGASPITDFPPPPRISSAAHRPNTKPLAWLDIVGPAFDVVVANTLKASHGPAQLIIARNSLDQIADLHAFFEAVGRILDEKGTFVIETRWSRDALRDNAFDTISADHLSLFSLHSLVKLCAYFDLVVRDVQRVPARGGSLRIFIGHSNDVEVRPAVRAMLDEELAAGLFNPETYDSFANRAADIRDNVLSLLWKLRGQGLRIAGYGAPENANTLLNYCGIGRSELDFLVDPDPRKHDMFSAGMKIPIRPLDALRTHPPDILLVLDDELARRSVHRSLEISQLGARFLVPLPRPRLVN